MKMTQSQKWLLFFASLMGFISVTKGVFGSQALKEKLAPEMLSAFEIGARYQMYHALAIFLAIWVSISLSSTLAYFSGWLFLCGSILFSGSLYLMAMTEASFLEAVTPIGGLVLLIGWFCLALSILKKVNG